MAPRANWKGYLKLSLVSCSVALYSATSVNQRVRFNIINKKTGHRVNNETVDSETREPVEKDQRVKGYEIEKNQYVLLEEDDFDKVALETTHTIEIDSFVPREEVDERYFDEIYYLAPEDAVGREAFAVIREAMRAKSVVGIARAVLYRRERILMLRPLGKGLVATSLRYKNEVRSEDAYFDEIPDVKLSQDMIDLAIHIVESKAAHFDPAQFEDRYENALIELIKAKAQGRPPHTIATQKPGNVINLMEALKRSIQSERPELRPPMPSPARRTTPKQTRPASRQTAKRGRAKRAG